MSINLQLGGNTGSPTFDTYENMDSIGIDGICIYYKNVKQVGVPGKVHLDLVKWFGEGRYQSLVGKWFCDKYNLELVK